MKNFFLLVLLLIGLYFYLRPAVETKPAPPVAAAPPATPKPRTYYHSPLDAPVMPVGSQTDMGYYSTDPVSRFGTGARLGTQSKTAGPTR